MEMNGQQPNITLQPPTPSMKVAVEVQNISVSYKLLPHVVLKQATYQEKEGYEAFEALKNVSFVVREGGILGVVGENGSGKSTLLRAIGGVFSPNSGKINLKGHSVSLMALGVGFKESLSGRNNIILSGMLLGYSEKEVLSKMDEIIEFSEIGDFIDMPVRTYSSGMYAKLAFSITAMLETEIMLIDEVLSVGDERFGQKSFNKMLQLITSKKHTVIIVSHNLGMLRQICNQVLWLHQGSIMELGAPEPILQHYRSYMSR